MDCRRHQIMDDPTPLLRALDLGETLYLSFGCITFLDIYVVKIGDVYVFNHIMYS